MYCLLHHGNIFNIHDISWKFLNQRYATWNRTELSFIFFPRLTIQFSFQITLLFTFECLGFLTFSLSLKKFLVSFSRKRIVIQSLFLEEVASHVFICLHGIVVRFAWVCKDLFLPFFKTSFESWWIFRPLTL